MPLLPRQVPPPLLHTEGSSAGRNLPEEQQEVQPGRAVCPSTMPQGAHQGMEIPDNTLVAKEN